MLANANLNSDYYLSRSKSASNNHDIIFLTGLMIILATVILTFMLIHFGSQALKNHSSKASTTNFSSYDGNYV